jgi:hypothetical protein
MPMNQELLSALKRIGNAKDGSDVPVFRRFGAAWEKFGVT